VSLGPRRPGKGNVLFLDGSPEGMQKQMQDLMALQQLNVVQARPKQTGE
jgi:prepilin-type processing-associated H-X9-DG protein